MDAPRTPLPTPSTAHAICAWCRMEFHSIVDLLDHVDLGHLDESVLDRPVAA